MKKLTALLASTFAALPSVAMAHDGHNGLGLYHHLVDGLAIIAVVVIVGIVLRKVVKQ